MTEKQHNSRQVKSKQRVTDHGEVFTAQREVNAMLDMVKQETERIDSRFLEPACGDGNFLAEILRRKLTVVKKRYNKNPPDYEKYAVVAATSIYGVDILPDNVDECRKRMFAIWNKEYTKVCKSESNDDCRAAVRFIFKRNILCGDALSLQTSEGKPIIFSEWSLVTGRMMKRRDFRLDVLMNENLDSKNYSVQMSLFEDDANGTVNWETDPETQKPVPKPVKEYPMIEYRRLQQYE